jgi:hypothetical protein
MRGKHPFLVPHVSKEISCQQHMHQNMRSTHIAHGSLAKIAEARDEHSFFG